MTEGGLHPRRRLASLVVVSAALLAVRLAAAARVGFGDSEALYASYALHPRPAYLDHPGLIGAVARTIGGGSAPSPTTAHVVTSICSTAVPWLMTLACRACGAPWRRALAGGVVTALVPEMAIGLFGLTPDLPLALSWIGALGLAALALTRSPSTPLATAAFAASGLLSGVAAASKVSGLLLALALAVAYTTPPARGHARTAAPWAGLAAGLLVVAPIGWFEVRAGWPMLRHRLIDTQSAAGCSLRNAFALVAGQLVYLSPGVAALAVPAFRQLWARRTDAVGALLLSACAVPGALLALLCLWSRVAEPHWVAPALLPLVPAYCRGPTGPPSKWGIAAVGLAGAMVFAVYGWALVPAAVRLAPSSYDPRLDITNELYGWPDVVAVVRSELSAAGSGIDTPPEDVAVVAPHWVLCGQLEAGLEGVAHVGCNTPVPDDFDDWWPRARWRAAEIVVWVSDMRFGPPPDLPGHATLRSRKVRVTRGGRVVREFTVTVLSRRALASASGLTRPSLAARRREAGRGRRRRKDSAWSEACRRRI
jgi:hypothetical protein